MNFDNHDRDDDDSYVPTLFGSDLRDDERKVLQLIWRTALDEARSTRPAQWPTWDYVQRALASKAPELVDVWTTIQGMPTVQRYSMGPTYGLLFAEPFDGGQPPQPAARIVLTIAGIAAVGSELADATAAAFLRALVAVALAEYSVEPQPFSVATATLSLDEIIRGEKFNSQEREILALWADQLPTILRREYLAPHFLNDDLVQLHGLVLRELLSIETIAEYLAKVAESDQTVDASPMASADLPLANTLDYLAMTLKLHPEWNYGSLIVIPELQALAGLFGTAISADEFNSRMYDLWAVLDRLGVPPVAGADQQPGSIARLDVWVRAHVDNDGRARIENAFRTIRQIRKLRSANAHPSRTQRADASAAAAALGIPVPTTDWSDALRIVRTELANSFETIRQEVSRCSAESPK